MEKDCPEIITLHNGEQIIATPELKKQVKKELRWLRDFCIRQNKRYQNGK